jgi:hypothetical protein
LHVYSLDLHFYSYLYFAKTRFAVLRECVPLTMS